MLFNPPHSSACHASLYNSRPSIPTSTINLSLLPMTFLGELEFGFSPNSPRVSKIKTLETKNPDKNEEALADDDDHLRSEGFGEIRFKLVGIENRTSNRLYR